MFNKSVVVVSESLCASVWQVRVVNVSQSYYDKYEVEITQVIKLGEFTAMILCFCLTNTGSQVLKY